MAAYPVMARGQLPSVNRDLLDDIGIGHLFQRSPDVPGLATGFAAACRARLFFPERVHRRRLAAVSAIETKPVQQQRNQQQQHFKAAFECRRKSLFRSNQVSYLLYRLFHIDSIDRHSSPRDYVLPHSTTGFKIGFFVRILSYAAFYFFARFPPCTVSAHQPQQTDRALLRCKTGADGTGTDF